MMLAAILLTCILLSLAHGIGVAVYNVTYHPLARFPGPKLLGAFKFPLLWSLFKGSSVRETKVLHDQYGSVVRIAPDHLSFNSSQAWKDIYGTRLGKRQLQKDEEWFVDHKEPVNIIKSNDADHSRIRKLVAHAFSDTALREQEPFLTTHTTKLIEKLRELIEGPEKGKVNMMNYFNFFAFDVIGDLCLGEPFGSIQSGQYDTWVAQIFVGLKFWRILRFGNVYPVVGYLFKFLLATIPALEAQRDTFFKLPKAKVEKRMSVETDRKDFMSYILRYNDDRGMSHSEIIDTASILIVGGSETTATLLCGLTYYVLTTPHVLPRLTQEIRSAFLSEGDINLLEVTKLPYLNAVVEESLRMYPPASSIFPRRTPQEGDIIDGIFVPGDTSIGVHHFATYRSSTNFVNPDLFDPERWLPEGALKYKNDNKAAFQPFQLGPRGCIGKSLAYFEIKSTIARLLWNFDLELCEESKDWARQNVFLVWEKGPLLVNLRHRGNVERL